MGFPTAQLASDHELHLARFAEETVSKMLAFADALAAGNTWRRPMDKLSGLMDLYTSISSVSGTLMPSLEQESRRLATWAEMESLFSKTEAAFSTTGSNLAKAIWRMAKDAEAVTPVLSGMDSWVSFPQNEEIHRSTRLIVDYARLFWGFRDELDRPDDVLYNSSNYDTEDQPQDFINLIVQMINNFGQQLEKKSESFSDSCLRYMFLLNNSYFIQDQFLASTGYSLAPKVSLKYEQYRENYIRESWERVLYCLHDKMPLWFPKHSSELARFKSEFKKTCRHQKLWKVPNPKLRKSLREDIIDKVINGYKRYMENHPDQEKCSSDQQDMEDTVNELFEG
uniref:Exocyst subunit Exo70 family protein n=1 Tax=Oryza punctata TaxID=4537 RepID=A0A0E0L1Q7_ORYPU